MKNIIYLLLVLFVSNLVAQDSKFGKVTKAELEERFYEKDSSAPAVYLFKNRITHYQFDQTLNQFILVTNVHERIKIYNKEGLEYANRNIAFYDNEDTSSKEEVSSIKGYTFNIENGEVTKEKLSGKQIFEEKKSKYWKIKKIAMPAVKEGSVIDVKYKLLSPYNRKIDDVNFQYGIPVKDFYAKIKIPEYYKFKLNTKGYFMVAPSKTSTRGSFTYIEKSRTQGSGFSRTNTSFSNDKVEFLVNEYVFKANDIPSINDKEPFVGSVKAYRGGAVFELSAVDFPGSPIKYYSQTWGDVVKSVHDYESFGGELKKTNFFKEDLASLLSGVESEQEKAVKIFSHIKSKVKWNNYNGKFTDNGVKKAYKEGVGNVADINLLLTSMLRESGLKANPVLVSTKENGVPIYPTIDGYNYVISNVEFSDGSNVLLDATSTYSTPNILPSRAINWFGRKVEKNGSSSVVNLKSGLSSISDTKLFVKIKVDNSIEGFMRLTLRDYKAFEFRNENYNKNDEALIAKYEERYDLEISDFKLSNKKELFSPILTSTKFTKEDGVEVIGDKLYLNPLLFLGITENPFKADERNYPIDFTTTWSNKYSVNITIPEGYKVGFIPENLAIGLIDDVGVFKFQTKQSGTKILVSTSLTFNKAIVSPENYEDVKSLFSEAVKKFNKKIVLIKQ